MSKDIKYRTQIMIRPSVKKLADKLQKKYKAKSLSDLIEKMIKEKAGE